MDEKTMKKVRELLGDSALDKVTGGTGLDGLYPTPSVEEVKAAALQIYAMFGKDVAIDYATTLLNCSRSEVEDWFSDQSSMNP